MTDIEASRQALLARILEGAGAADAGARRAAFDGSAVAEPVRALLEKVGARAHEVGDEDVARARASGMSEDEIFEIVVCAAVGRATRRHEAALSALRACTKAK
jgi:alkylhydroperoxidase family enzyme